MPHTKNSPKTRTPEPEADSNDALSLPQPTLSIDVALYEHYLEHSGWTPEQKQLFLESLWYILCQFALLGYGITPEQQAIQRFCEEASGTFEKISRPSHNPLEPKTIQVLTEHFTAIPEPTGNHSKTGR